MSMPYTIGFAGMTHLGVNSAAAVAEKGFRVVAYDVDAAVIDRLKAGVPPVVEPDLDDLLARHRDAITYTTSLAELGRCDVVYISTDVPTDDSGRSDLGGIASLCETVTAVLAPHAVLVVLCQVPPGFTRALTGPAPDRRYYQVETLIFGRAVERALYPERYIIGCADAEQPLPPAFAALLGAFGCPLLPMRYESAELAKISINFCLVASVSVANTLAELCEAIGADWSEIVPALKLDKRIGPNSYLTAGLGLAGGNLERDLATVLRLSETHANNVDVVSAWLRNSSHRKDWPFQVLSRAVLVDNPQARVAVLGLAYKENTHSTKNAPSLVLLSHLDADRTVVYDPVVRADDLGLGMVQASSALDAAKGADAVMLVTPWPEFRELAPAALANVMAGRVVVDPYRLLDPAACRTAGLRQICLGAPSAGGE